MEADVPTFIVEEHHFQVRNWVADYMLPASLVILDSLPQTPWVRNVMAQSCFRIGSFDAVVIQYSIFAMPMPYFR